MAQIALAAGAALKAGGSIISANSQAKDLRKQAAQLEANAGLERASSQRKASEERRQARLATSRGVALAAASGGGVDDPSVINLLEGIAGEGEYRALSALYEGNQSALSMEDQAKSARKQAKATKTAGYINAASSLLSTGTSLFDRVGGK